MISLSEYIPLLLSDCWFADKHLFLLGFLFIFLFRVCDAAHGDSEKNTHTHTLTQEAGLELIC